MKLGTIEYGTWENGASIYKDSKGYYTVEAKFDNSDGKKYNVSKVKTYKNYLKNWKLSKEANYKWSSKKTNKQKRTKNTKYANRPSPPYPANENCGKTKKGNDGKMYFSKANKNGICRWIKK